MLVVAGVIDNRGGLRVINSKGEVRFYQWDEENWNLKKESSMGIVDGKRGRHYLAMSKKRGIPLSDMITSREGAEELGIGFSTYTDWCRKLGFKKTGNAYILTRKQVNQIEASIFREGKRLPKSSYKEGVF